MRELLKPDVLAPEQQERLIDLEVLSFEQLQQLVVEAHALAEKSFRWEEDVEDTALIGRFVNSFGSAIGIGKKAVIKNIM